jgi:hypothetical protein
MGEEKSRSLTRTEFLRASHLLKRIVSMGRFGGRREKGSTIGPGQPIPFAALTRCSQGAEVG